MKNPYFTSLNKKLDELIQLCTDLEHENRELRTRENTWEVERRKLMDKNEMARGKIEAMIKRLKTMEQNS